MRRRQTWALRWLVAAEAWRGTLVLATLVVAVTTSATASATAADGPLTTRAYRTTSAAIALGNLNGQIHDLERLGTVGAPERIELLLLRGQYFGRIADYEQADALATELVAARPTDPQSYLARARTGARWHRFEAALHDLDDAERLARLSHQVDVARAPSVGQIGPATAIESTRAGILQATGRFDEALVIRRRHAERAPDVLTLGALASVIADLGDTTEATRLFRAAEAAYRDVAPFPLTWIAERQGLMWLRAGDLERARSFYAAAHERLPQYPAVAAQLGWLEAAHGSGTVAVAVLRDAAATSDDPLTSGLLAYVLPLAGAQAEAALWRDRARVRYEELLRVHPEAFAHHAAEFFLGPGADPVRALTLARRDLDVRRTPAAYALVLRAAETAGDSAVVCEAAAAYLQHAGFTPSLSPLSERAGAERAQARCVADGRIPPTTPAPGAAPTPAAP